MLNFNVLLNFIMSNNKVKNSSYVPDLVLDTTTVPHSVKCECAITNKSECKYHAFIKVTKVKEERWGHYPCFARKEMIPWFVYDFTYYCALQVEFMIAGLYRPLNEMLSVSVFGWTTSWCKYFFECKILNLISSIQKSGQRVSSAICEKNDVVYMFVIVSNKVVEILSEINDKYLPEVPLFRVLNGRNLMIKFCLLFVITPIKALPDYVLGASQIKSDIIMTYYWVDYPNDFKRTGRTLDFGSCKGESYGNADVNFLKNMALDGTGVVDGVTYNLGSCNCNGRYFCFEKVENSSTPYGLTTYGTPLIPFITIAANDIDRGIYFIPQIVGWQVPGSSLQHNGCVQVDDTGNSFDKNHVDFFVYRMKYYGIWDHKYNSPNVDVYSVKTCPLLDYVNSTSSDNEGVGSNSGCVCPTSTVNNTKSKSGSVQSSIAPTSFLSASASRSFSNLVTSYINSVQPTPTSNNIPNYSVSLITVSSVIPTIIVNPQKLEIDKRSSVARMESCSGYNCWPVHILLIVSTCVVLVCPIIPFVLRYRYPGLVWIVMVFISVYTGAVMIYSIIALQSVGPVKLRLIDTGLDKRSFDKRGFYIGNNCENKANHYLIMCGIGGFFMLLGLILLIKRKKHVDLQTLKGKLNALNTKLINVSIITFGLGVLLFSLIVYFGYRKCFDSHGIKFVCDFAAGFVWTTVSATAIAFVMVFLQMVLHYFSFVLFITKVDIVKPIMTFIFGMMAVLITLYFDGKDCYSFLTEPNTLGGTIK
jgi:hypothetical protein